MRQISRTQLRLNSLALANDRVLGLDEPFRRFFRGETVCNTFQHFQLGLCERRALAKLFVHHVMSVAQLCMSTSWPGRTRPLRPLERIATKNSHK